VSHSAISLGLGLGGGKSATSSGAAGGGGAAFNVYSVDFDGADDYVGVTPDENIELYGLSMWFSCDTTVTHTAIDGILFGPDATTNWFLALGGNITGPLTDELISINTGARYGYCSSDPADVIPTGWHHVVAAWSTSSATNGGSNGYDIYLDGVKVGNAASTTYGAATLYTLASGSTFRIGQRGNAAYPYDGLIDEVAIFDSTLTAANVTTLWNSGTPGDITTQLRQPAGWWRMGDNNSGSGITITDQGSGGNDGTLTNGPTFAEDVPS
tara:strand:+ start:279 stop:1085 length:807 start_codon:yes stop_codon:yes gene_type:complete